MSNFISVGTRCRKLRLAAKLAYLISWAFWSKDNESDYYVSLEDDSAYYSLTEKE